MRAAAVLGVVPAAGVAWRDSAEFEDVVTRIEVGR
jgi:hypothetical protein